MQRTRGDILKVDRAQSATEHEHAAAEAVASHRRSGVGGGCETQIGRQADGAANHRKSGDVHGAAGVSDLQQLRAVHPDTGLLASPTTLSTMVSEPPLTSTVL